MTGETVALVGWAAVLAVQLVASVVLHRWFGIIVASQGATALVAAWAFAVSWQSGWGMMSLPAAIAAGAVSGVVHLLLYWLAGRDVLLVVSVLMSFFINDLWLSVPDLTGGSGGLLVVSSSPSAPWVCVGTGLLLAAVNHWGLTRLDPIAGPAMRQLGLFAGVLGVPVLAVYAGTFAVTGAAIGCAGAAGALTSGLAQPGLFSPGWSLSILTMVVAPKLSPVVRMVGLPFAFVFTRLLLREAMPPSVGYSQIAEMAFPCALVLWTRFSSEEAGR